MSDPMKIKIEAKLWKICFILDDSDCTENRLINRRALETLTAENEKDFIHEIEENTDKFIVSDNRDIKLHLVAYLAKYPDIYKALGESTKFIINKFTDNDSIGKTFSWFRYDSMPKLLEDYELTDNIKTSALLTMYTEYKKNGYLKGVLDFFIKYFARSGNYDTANERFEYAFKHYLKEMNSEQLINVIQAINNNDQIHGRRNAYYDNAIVAYYAKKR